MFLIDVSPSMGAIRTVQVETSTGQTQTVEMTHLEYGLQFIKLKIQEMVATLGIFQLSYLLLPRYSMAERQTDVVL